MIYFTSASRYQSVNSFWYQLTDTDRWYYKLVIHLSQALHKHKNVLFIISDITIGTLTNTSCFRRRHISQERVDVQSASLLLFLFQPESSNKHIRDLELEPGTTT